MKKKDKNVRIFTTVALVVFGGLFVFAIVGLSRTVNEIEEIVVSGTPEAILASAEVDDGGEINLPVAYFDQKADNCINLYDVSLKDELYKRQFEWASCGYANQEIEQGLVEYDLGQDNLPVAVGGKLTSNRGVSDMGRWFKSVDGKSQAYAGTIKMNYRANGSEFEFTSDEFYPLDEASFSSGDLVNGDGHNRLFTMSFAVPFTTLLSGEEKFEITADDDTFVFVGTKLAIDMGGIHGAALGRIGINEDGEIYTAINEEDLAYSGIRLEKNEGSIIRIFHADRDSNGSIFKIAFRGMNLNLINTELAKDGESGVQVAYDPTDPSYVAPLGVSSVFRPDSTKGRMVLATIYGTLIVVFAILFVMAARQIIKRKIEK